MHKSEKSYTVVTFRVNQDVVVFNFIVLKRKSEFLGIFSENAEKVFMIL